MTIQLTITKAANDYIKTMLSKNNDKIFRLSIKKTGCANFSYYPSLENHVASTDIIFNSVDNVTLYIDANWLELLQGTLIDYIEEEQSGLKQKKLVFKNRNEAGRCGCGSSFHVER